MDAGVLMVGVAVVLFLLISAGLAVLGGAGLAFILFVSDIGPALLLVFLFNDLRKVYGLASDILDDQRIRAIGGVAAVATLQMICVWLMLAFPGETSRPIPDQFSLWTLSAIFLVTLSFTFYLGGRQRYFRDVVKITLRKRRRGARSKVRQRGVRKMAADGDTESLARILTSDPNFNNRLIAAKALANYSGQAGVYGLNIGLRYEEPDVRLACAIALAKCGDQEGRQLVETQFVKGNDWDRVFIVSSLASLDQAWATRLVQVAREHSSRAVREAAEHALSHASSSD
jgi:hypothetical protein